MTAPISIAELDRIAGVVLDVLWRSSWQASVLAGVVLLMQFALRERLPARWRHALWAIVLLRLMIPVTPPSPWSLFNVAPRPVALPPSGVFVIIHPPGLPLAPSRGSTVPTWKLALASTWLIGTAWMLARIAWASVMLWLSVRWMKRVDDGKLLALLARCRRELDVRRRGLTVLSAPTIAAPALMGFFKPRLLLPPAVIECFDADELRHILLHELAHLRRHDVAINWLASVLQAVHWFNPMIWLAMARLRNDRELAADELVLTLTAGDAPPRDAYGNTLVKLLQTLSTPSRRHSGAALSGTVGILEGAHPMRRRITMIAQFQGKNARRWTLAAAACMLVLLGIGLTDAVRGDSPATRPPTRPASNAASADDRSSLADLKKKTRQLISEQRYDEALVVIDRILQTDPGDDYASGVRALVRDKSDLARQRTPASSQPAVADEPPPQTAEEHAVAVLLSRPLPEVHFDGVGLSDVVDFLRDITGANMYVNWRALEAAGIDRNTPITMRLKETPFEQVLNQLTRDVSGGGDEKAKIEFAIDGRVLVISTQQELATHPQMRSFEVKDLLEPQDQGSAAALEKVLATQVPGVSITAYHDQLLVKGSTGQIRDVEKALNALRGNR